MVTLPSTSVDWSSVRISPVEVTVSAPLPVDRELPTPIEPVPTSTVDPIAVVIPSVESEVVEKPAPASFFETIEIEEIEQILETEPAPMAPAETVSSFLEPPLPIAEEAPAVAESTEIEAEAEAEPIADRTIDPESFPVEASYGWSSTEIATQVPTGRIEASAWVEELSEDEIDGESEVESPLTEVLPTTIELEPAPVHFTPDRWPGPPVVEAPIEIGLPRADYPSARAIFAAQGRRSQSSSATISAPSPSPSSRRRQVEPMPTEFLGPDHWRMPVWLGLIPAVAATLFLGILGLSLAYEWTIEASGSNLGLKLAVRPDTPSSPLIDPSLIPRGGWWITTATHLAAWAVAIERANDGEDHSEDVRSLLLAAREASPLSARARFNVEAPEGATVPVAPNDFSEIGRTRDVVSLIGTGRRLRESGKVEASIRAYRSAIELALLADRKGLEPPIFDENSQVRRYALPHEALIDLVVRSMAERGEWTVEQWTSALPSSAVASWVASKVLARLQKKAESDFLVDLAIRQAETAPPTGSDPAEPRAAVAEALAFRGRWTDASEQYRLAIDQVEDDATRRAWWLNLSELAHRMSDTAAQARAIEAAQSPDSVDEITTRARKYQETIPPVSTPGFRR
jgi:hypothetical protein